LIAEHGASPDLPSRVETYVRWLKSASDHRKSSNAYA
jgi:hypothetical protein